MASCEILIEEIWKILAPSLREITDRGVLHSIRLYETRNNFVEFFGEGLEPDPRLAREAGALEPAHL
jgi:hypothetical protein